MASQAHPALSMALQDPQVSSRALLTVLQAPQVFCLVWSPASLMAWSLPLSQALSTA
jgi:hypothetical protein